jgi:hypothetical protein
MGLKFNKNCLNLVWQMALWTTTTKQNVTQACLRVKSKHLHNFLGNDWVYNIYVYRICPEISAAGGGQLVKCDTLAKLKLLEQVLRFSRSYWLYHWGQSAPIFGVNPFLRLDFSAAHYGGRSWGWESKIGNFIPWPMDPIIESSF